LRRDVAAAVGRRRGDEAERRRGQPLPVQVVQLLAGLTGRGGQRLRNHVPQFVVRCDFNQSGDLHQAAFSFAGNGWTALVRAAHRTAGPVAQLVPRNSAPTTIQPIGPQPRITVVSSAGPSMRAIAGPVPKKPWYCPCLSAGASPKLISHAPDASFISPSVSSAAA